MVLRDKRAILIRAYRLWLNRDDLEEIYSQASLEVWQRSIREPFKSPEHIRRALEQKFQSRIFDRRRAINGRSPDASYRADTQLELLVSEPVSDSLEHLCEQRERILRGLKTGATLKSVRQGGAFKRHVLHTEPADGTERKRLYRARLKLAGI